LAGYSRADAAAPIRKTAGRPHEKNINRRIDQAPRAPRLMYQSAGINRRAGFTQALIGMENYIAHCDRTWNQSEVDNR